MEFADVYGHCSHAGFLNWLDLLGHHGAKKQTIIWEVQNLKHPHTRSGFWPKAAFTFRCTLLLLMFGAFNELQIADLTDLPKSKRPFDFCSSSFRPFLTPNDSLLNVIWATELSVSRSLADSNGMESYFT